MRGALTSRFYDRSATRHRDNNQIVSVTRPPAAAASETANLASDIAELVRRVTDSAIDLSVFD